MKNVHNYCWILGVVKGNGGVFKMGVVKIGIYLNTIFMIMMTTIKTLKKYLLDVQNTLQIHLVMF